MDSKWIVSHFGERPLITRTTISNILTPDGNASGSPLPKSVDRGARNGLGTGKRSLREPKEPL